MFSIGALFGILIFIIIILAIIDGMMDAEGWLFIIMGMVLASVTFSNIPSEKRFVKFEKTEVHSTAMNYNSIQGSFFLGTGYINSKEMYSANVYLDGAYERFYIPVVGTRRIIDEDLTDTAIYMKAICKYVPTWLFSRDTHNYSCPYDIKKSELYIPKNTLIKQLNFQ